mmetsp:Transcript_13675/g.21430  ORF Transcript_13675/g.21430 Transcript_13675/m.21430 type:complete len:119 (+) Transcript_13675:3781-4137(+)
MTDEIERQRLEHEEKSRLEHQEEMKKLIAMRIEAEMKKNNAEMEIIGKMLITDLVHSATYDAVYESYSEQVLLESQKLKKEKLEMRKRLDEEARKKKQQEEEELKRLEQEAKEAEEKQ